ncbi:MBL fold metallo-hydrolase [Aspergillus foveolatus]|uniref:MBL fold metallo-hydrolase n=1 Tax=Aspergillus foveolatus TaxID=210207 RepID=UPI003CCDF6FC
MASTSLFPDLLGDTIVDVSVIHAGQITLPTKHLITEPVPSHDNFNAPCFSFLVENKAKKEKLLFDLGLTKAWREKFPPAIVGMVESLEVDLHIEKDVADHLHEAEIPLKSINSIIWSHHHIDHIGDPSLFPSSTSLIVGPGFKSDKTIFPGYPTNPDAKTADDAFRGREVVELDFSQVSLEIGGFPAMDYFGDGSFFLLQTKGHTHDHISALARTKKDKFIFLGGGVAHHAGEFRPTAQLPLPDEMCCRSVIERSHPRKGANLEDYRTIPFYQASPEINASMADAEATVKKLQAFDASAEVFVIIAHDKDLLGILPDFPIKINDWDSKGYKPLGRWRFLEDFSRRPSD